jgi:hypothetical protein
MSDKTTKKDYDKFKEENEITSEEEIVFKIEGSAMIVKDNTVGVQLSTEIIGRSDIIVSSIAGAMMEDENISNLILEAARKFMIQKLAQSAMKEVMDTDEDVDLTEVDIPNEVKDKLNLSQLFNGLNPKEEC